MLSLLSDNSLKIKMGFGFIFLTGHMHILMAITMNLFFGRSHLLGLVYTIIDHILKTGEVNH